MRLVKDDLVQEAIDWDRSQILFAVYCCGLLLSVVCGCCRVLRVGVRVATGTGFTVCIHVCIMRKWNSPYGL